MGVVSESLRWFFLSYDGLSGLGVAIIMAVLLLALFMLCQPPPRVGP